MSSTHIRNPGTVLAALLALALFLITPLAVAGHDHAHDVAEECTLCILSSTAIDHDSPLLTLIHFSRASQALYVESDSAQSVDIIAERPARAPPAA